MTDAGGNPIDYDSDVGWCPDCGDVELTCELVWETATQECFRYTCPACGYANEHVATFDPNAPSILPLTIRQGLPPYES